METEVIRRDLQKEAEIRGIVTEEPDRREAEAAAPDGDRTRREEDGEPAARDQTGEKAETGPTGRGRRAFRDALPVYLGIALVLAALVFLLGRSGGELEILTQPKDAAGNPDETVRFTVVADGSGLSYQWQFRTGESGEWEDCSAEGSNTLLLPVEAKAYRSGYQYRCAVTDGEKTVYSEPATLLVIGKPEIVLEPESREVKLGETARFSFGVYGLDLQYKWQFRTGSKGAWKDCTTEGCTTPTLTIKAEEHRNGYQYRCVASNRIDKVSSKAVTLTVCSKPGIKTQPKDASAKLGETVTFTVETTGSGLRYQWQFRTNADGKWKDCSAKGSNTAFYSVKVEEHRNGYQYRCRVKNSLDTLYTNVVTLSIAGELTITAQPESVTAREGETVRFSVSASGSSLRYQWQYRTSEDGAWNDSSSEGCKTATLTVKAEERRNGYQYRCVVSDSSGSASSEPASLTVKK